MEDKYKPLEADEILSFDYLKVGKYFNLNSNNFQSIILKTSDFLESLRIIFNINNEIKESLFTNGIACEAWKFGAKGWEKGKLRIKVTIEFCPDEPEIEETTSSNELQITQSESPLDDLRQKLNEITS